MEKQGIGRYRVQGIRKPGGLIRVATGTNLFPLYLKPCMLLNKVVKLPKEDLGWVRQTDFIFYLVP